MLLLSTEFTKSWTRKGKGTEEAKSSRGHGGKGTGRVSFVSGDQSSELSPSGEVKLDSENETILAERLGTEAQVFLNEYFGVELVLEDNSLQAEIREQVVVKPEIRFVTCSQERDTSRWNNINLFGIRFQALYWI